MSTRDSEAAARLWVASEVGAYAGLSIDDKIKTWMDGGVHPDDIRRFLIDAYCEGARSALSRPAPATEAKCPTCTCVDPENRWYGFRRVECRDPFHDSTAERHAVKPEAGSRQESGGTDSDRHSTGAKSGVTAGETALPTPRAGASEGEEAREAALRIEPDPLVNAIMGSDLIRLYGINHVEIARFHAKDIARRYEALRPTPPPASEGEGNGTDTERDAGFAGLPEKHQPSSRPTPPPAEVEARLKDALRAETRRRQWARIYGCYVGWGIINSDEHAQGAKAILGVIATDENFGGPYRRHKESEAYVPQPTNLGGVSPEEAERAECAAIDKMIAAAEAAERAERGGTKGGGK